MTEDRDIVICVSCHLCHWFRVTIVDMKRLPNKLPYLLMGGHICVDAAQGGLASVLPFLALQVGYSYVQITSLVLASNIASAVIQPLFGWLGDRVARPWLMALGVALAGIGIALVGVLEAYPLVVAAAMVSGIGNAMLHPEGARLANLTGGADKAVSMSVFSVGGQVGFCLGPIISVVAISLFGLPGTLVYLAICLPYAALLLTFNRRFKQFGLREEAADASGDHRDRWGAFSVVLGALSVRSVVFYGVTSFFPLFLITVFGSSEDASSLLITAFSIAGAVATAASGFASHRIPTPRLMVLCFAAMTASLIIFVMSGNLWLCVGIVLVLAVCVNLFNPSAVALGQSYLPEHLGMASGLSFGVAVCVGGVASPLLGALGDAIGLVPVIWIMVAVAAVGFACSLGVLAISRRDDGSNRS